MRVTTAEETFEKGINSIVFYGTEVENVLERIIVIRKDKKAPGCYLGPAESPGKS